MEIFEGIVLKERTVGEQDKFIDILTKEQGVLELAVKGAKKITSRNAGASQLFAYSRFCIQKRGNRLYLNSAEPIHIFYDLRKSLNEISLASYFSDVIRFCCIQERSGNRDVLRLVLNCLHYLEKNLRSQAMLKSIFELRIMSEIGYMPNVLGCRECGVYEAERMYFDINSGSFICGDCLGTEETLCYEVSGAVLDAIRHIVLTDFDRLFNFRLSDSAQKMLSEISEQYLTSHLERTFSTLDFYKSL